MDGTRPTDDDPFTTGGHGRFLVDGVAPQVIGGTGPQDDGAWDTVRVDPREVSTPAYDRDPPTRPIPQADLAEAAQPEKGWLSRLFGR